ncbi:hypothetical protein [Poriferisphaera sp. WC338]|uniref:hypothetical protein n=1 Tax=Poriferisphaera sp. WC338 TaxID=3425129 RepID=UPI003D81633D
MSTHLGCGAGMRSGDMRRLRIDKHGQDKEMLCGIAETWAFTVECNEPIDVVLLVKETSDGVTSWIEMRHVDDHVWMVDLDLKEGWYRFRYYTSRGKTFINCGTYGLQASLIKGYGGAVMIEAFEHAASA